MADKLVAAVWAKPRRRIGLPIGLAVFIAAVVLLWSGLSNASRAARPTRALVTAAQRQSIDAKVTALLNQMTVARSSASSRWPGRASRMGVT
jgi:hypothetical protein